MQSAIGTIVALIIRIGFGDMFYFNYIKDPPPTKKNNNGIGNYLGTYIVASRRNLLSCSFGMRAQPPTKTTCQGAAQGLEFRVSGLGLRVLFWGLGFRVEGFGFWCTVLSWPQLAGISRYQRLGLGDSIDFHHSIRS